MLNLSKIKKMAWHREYTDEEIQIFKETIIDRLANGKSLREILRNDKKLPSRRFVYQWLNPNNEKWYDAAFNNHYTLAREESADIDVDKLEQIADRLIKGDMDAGQARAAADILKWTAGRKKPKKYGTTKVDFTTGGNKLTQQVVQFRLPENNRDKNMIAKDEAETNE